jgi:hypothetical protein
MTRALLLELGPRITLGLGRRVLNDRLIKGRQALTTTMLPSPLSTNHQKDGQALIKASKSRFWNRSPSSELLAYAMHSSGMSGPKFTQMPPTTRKTYLHPLSSATKMPSSNI